MKKYYFIVLIVMIIFAAGCPNGTTDQPTDPSVPATEGETENISDTIAEGKSRITFMISNSVQSRGRAVQDKDLFWYNIYTSQSGYQSLSDGENSVDLDKDGIYVLSIVSKNQPGIVNQGFIGLGSIGIELIPLGASAETIIDLGQIDSSTYTSSLSLQDAVDNLGFSAELLGSFRGFDTTFKKFLNPDIDQNNIYDYEEEKYWWLTGFVFRHLNTSLFNFSTESMSLDASDLMQPDFEYVFNFWSGIPTTQDTSVVSLTLPTDKTILTDTGVITSLIDPRYNGPEIMEGHYPQYYFDTSAITSPSLPISGDFKLNINGSEYHLDNLEFAKPEDNYEGYTFPLFNYTRNALGVFKDISWQWKTVREGEIVDASTDEIKIKIQNVQIYLGETPTNYPPEDFGFNYWENGSVDVEYMGCIRSDSDYDSISLRTSYTNRAGNNNGYRFYDDNSSVPMPQEQTIDSLFSPVDDIYNSILAIWENPAYYSDANNGKMVFYKNGMSVIYPNSSSVSDSVWVSFEITGTVSDPEGIDSDVIQAVATTEDGANYALSMRRVADILEFSALPGITPPAYFNEGDAPVTYTLVKEVLK